MTSKPGTQTVAIHVFPNISRSKDNQVIKFNQLQNVVEKLFPDPFLKSKLSMYLNQYSKVLYSLFLLYAKLGTIKIYWKSCRPIAFTLYKAFLKNKKRSRDNKGI